MPWFICDNCGESIKKPKVASHARQCHSNAFTCLDCSRTFDGWSVAAHNTCVTEHEKYAQGATKPGGYAAKGCYEDKNGKGNKAGGQGGPIGLEFLSSRPPWKCTVCNVACTSREALEGHAAGTKHCRRARAALAEANKGQQGGDGGAPVDEPSQQTEEPSAKRQKTTSEEVAAPKPSNTTSPTSPVKDTKKTKWKKLASAELKKNGNSMKLKQLTKTVLSRAGKDSASLEELLDKLQHSGQFKVEGKHIHLTHEQS